MSEVRHEAATYETPYLDSAVAVFSLLADAVRVKIVLALRDVEMTVNHLADITDLDTESVLIELGALEEAGIIAREPDGRCDFYRLANEHTGALAANAIFHAEHRDAARPSTPPA